MDYWRGLTKLNAKTARLALDLKLARFLPHSNINIVLKSFTEDPMQIEELEVFLCTRAHCNFLVNHMQAYINKISL